MYPDPSREVSAPNTDWRRPNLALESSGKAPTKEKNHIHFPNGVSMAVTHAGLWQDPARVQNAFLASSYSLTDA